MDKVQRRLDVLFASDEVLLRDTPFAAGLGNVLYGRLWLCWTYIPYGPLGTIWARVHIWQVICVLLSYVLPLQGHVDHLHSCFAINVDMLHMQREVEILHEYPMRSHELTFHTLGNRPSPFCSGITLATAMALIPWTSGSGLAKNHGEVVICPHQQQ